MDPVTEAKMVIAIVAALGGSLVGVTVTLAYAQMRYEAARREQARLRNLDLQAERQLRAKLNRAERQLRT